MCSKFGKNIMAGIRFCTPYLQLSKLLLVTAFMLLPQLSTAAESICAVVKIEIAQELTLERQAFDAHMIITNGLDTASIDNININVTFEDENGVAVLATSDTTSTTAKFFITLDSMTNLTAIDGTDSLLPKSTADIHWLIVPAPGASNGIPSGTLYFIGASLSYNLAGVAENVTVTPDFIYVKPMPLLTLDYFLTQDVIADDPFTAAIEPAEPFYLGVRVRNNGQAIAKNVKIDSAQPKIVENKLGLLINFVITGSSIDDQPSVPSLLLGLGDIPGNGAKVGRWDMETTLAGTFTAFTAEFSHSDAYGGALTSLIQAVNTHFLVRNVIVDAPGRDLIRDFLALDASTLRVYESNGVDTAISDQSTGATFTSFGTSGPDSIYTLTMPVVPGLTYVKLVDPFNGTNEIKEVVRSDGKYIPQANVWFSKVKNRTTQLWEYYVNFFDVDSTGTYSVRMGPPIFGPTAPNIQFINNRTTYEGNPIGFIVQATDVNNDVITWTATNLPIGASFVDNGNGQASLNWTPSIGQAGIYTITYRATDRTTLFSERTASIRVNPANDIDGDGMDDAWEIAMFGDLTRDGTGDFDGDGISDLDEFLNGTDPTVVPPLPPANLLVAAGNAETTSTWTISTGATGYNIYWSLSAGVTKTTGTLISNVSSPYVHTGLVNDTTYYYIVTANGVGGESNASNEASVKAGIKQWGTPQLNETNNLGDASNTKIAMNGNGDAVTVREQSNGTETHIVASIYTNAVGWSADIALETNAGNATNPAVAIDSNKNIIVVWQQDDAGVQSIWQSRYDATTQLWSTAATLEIDAVNNALNPTIAMDSSGRAAVVWSQSDATVHAVLYVPASGWLAESRIESDTTTTISGTSVVMDISGNALVTWSNTSDGITYNIMSNRYVAGTGWGASSTTVRSAITNDAGATTLIASLTGGVNGNAIAVWSETDAIRNNIWASHFDPATGWTATLTAIETNDVAGAYAPVVSMDNSGNAVAIWNHSDGTVRSLWASHYTTAGGWVATTTAIETDNTASTSNAKVMTGFDGSIVALWQQSDGVNQNIWSNVFDPVLAAWGTAQIIETENLGDASNADLGRNLNGDAIAYWQQHDGTRLNGWINTYNTSNTGVPNILPVASSNGNQTVTAGANVSLDASSSFDQDGTIASYSWTQTIGTLVTLNTATSAIAGFIAPTVVNVEVLTFSVTVTDDVGGTATTTVNITVNPAANVLPTVDAGVAQTVNEQTVVNLSGSATDSDGTITSLVWSQVSGSVVIITDSGIGTASFTSPTLLTSEILTFRLTATDNNGGVSTADIAITVNPVNALPTANAGIAQTVNEQTVVNLSGGATDSDGTISSLVWSQVSGTVVVIIDSGTGTASFTAPTLTATAVLTFRLTATDNEGGVSSADVAITVNPVNTAPTVNPGPAQTVNEQTIVNLSGSASDTDGTITSLVWSQASGTAVVMTDSGNGTANFTTPTLTATAYLVFTLTATDNEGAVSVGNVAITVNPVNALPTVNQGLTQNVNEQTLVTLNGSATDSDGTIVSLVWTQVSGTVVVVTDNGAGVANFTTLALTIQEALMFRLTATDNEGGVSSADVAVVVNPVNALPTANAGVAQTVNEQTTVNLSGTGSDTDGTISSLVWSQLTGTAVLITNSGTGAASFVAPTITATEILTFRLTVTDNESGVTTSDVAITVNPVNALPTVSPGIAQTVNEQTTVNLSGSATDSDGTITTLVWAQLTGTAVVITDGGTGSASFTAPTLTAIEILTFRLTVTDNEGGVSSADIAITVNPVNAIPTANAGTAQTVNEQTTVSLSGSATDSDGTIATLVWSQLTGTAVVMTDSGTGTASFTAPTIIATEILTFRFTVTDNEGATASADVSITVNPVNALPVANAGPAQSVNEQTLVNLTGSATDTDGTIASLVWSQVAGTTVVITDSGTGAASFTAPALTVSEILTFRLTATDNEGGVATADVAITVNPALDVTAPTQVNGVVATSTSNSVMLSWNASSDTESGVASYRVYRDGGVTPLATVTVLAYTDTGLIENTSYSYEVTAVDGAGNESLRSVATVVSTLIGTITPILQDNNDAAFTHSVGWESTATVPGYYGTDSIVGTPGAGTKWAQWNMTVPNADSYEVQAYVYGNSYLSTTTPYSVTHDGGIAQVSLNLQLLTGWQWVSLGTYTISSGATTVQLTDVANGYVMADAVRLVPQVTDTTAPTVPATLSGSATSAFTVTLNWGTSTDTQSGVSHYSVYRNGGVTSIGISANLTFTDFTVNANTTYSYQVRAVDFMGNESALSNVISATTPANTDFTRPTQVTGVIATPLNSATISLSWNASSDADTGVIGYLIYRDGGFFPIAQVLGLNYIDLGLTPNTLYGYQVVAVDRATNLSFPSAIVATVTPP